MHVPACLLRCTFLVAAVLSLGRVALTGAEPPAPASRDAQPTLFICGDSTAAKGRPPIQGWGEVVGEFFAPAQMHVENHALGGRSARTFIEEGRWAAVDAKLRTGDVVLLQFGHNDSKSALSIDRYDLSGTGPEVATVKNPRTGATIELHTFGYYLGQMIDQAKARGAKVVVLSPVPRSKWAEGKIVRGEEEHARWAAEVAKAKGVPYVDVNAMIADVYDPIGRTRIKALYFPQDNTHTNPAGARLNAAVVVKGLLALNDPAITAGLAPQAAATVSAVIAAVPPAAATIPLSLPVTTAFPAAKAANVCPDTPLRLTFASAATLGTKGLIHIVDAATGKDVDTIDIAVEPKSDRRAQAEDLPTARKTIGGEPNYRYYPILLSGTEATIYPRNGALAYNQTYYVTIDAGVFRDETSDYAALGAGAWQFTTKAAAPAAGTSELTVAADGTADFCTVQGALDFVPEGNTRPVTIHVRQGTYTEIVFFSNKHGITIQGESRAETVIAYATNDRFNNSSGNPFGAANPNPSAARVGGHIYHRGVFLAHHVNDLTLANLTIRNTTPQGGSQAEAIILNGTTTARAILKDVDLYSYQDTLQINGQAYLNGCYIEGDVDFMWGTGPCYFENCICRALRSGAYYTQIRNPGTNHGYVYAHCVFDGALGIMGNYLSRIGTGRFPHSEVVLLDCTLTTAVGPVAWQFQGGREGNEADAAQVHFWEFNSHDPAGAAVDMTYRLPGSKRLAEPADAEVIRQYRDLPYVLGNGWNPKAAAIFAAPATAAATAKAAAPVITVQPASQLALLGTTVSLDVAATGGAGRMSYQWYKNGHALPGAGSSTLRLSAVGWDDAAIYTAVARNEAGQTTSQLARITAVAPQASAPPTGEGGGSPRGGTPPDLPRIPERAFDVTSFGAVGDGATDNTGAIQGAINAALAAGGGTVTIPAAAQPYLCGPLTLGSSLDLEVAAGAVLRLLPYAATPHPGSYPLSGDAFANFLTAANAHDVALTGAGTIDGDGPAWWAAFRADKRMPHRPYLVRFNRCQRVLVSGLTFTRSPMFHVAINADHLTVFGITVATPDGTPNTDGVDPSGSHHLIQNCAISCGDDNVVMKPGGAFCSDITVADCAFGEGHGMSVGGQSNRGLDGMTVKNCSFDGTTSALRLKADPTQGGEVKNIVYTNITMQRVPYPIVFYSYYNKIGNPAGLEGNNLTTPAKAQSWNTTPPNSLATRTMPSWKSLTLANLYATGTKAYSILWGLPAEGFLIENVRFVNVHSSGGPGIELYNATNVQFSAGTEVGKVTACNALAITRAPQHQAVKAGAAATFTTEVVAMRGTAPATTSYQWTYNGQPLTDGPTKSGSTVAGATTPSLKVEHVSAADAGKYALMVSATLDGFDPNAKTLSAGIACRATSAPATLTVASAP